MLNTDHLKAELAKLRAFRLDDDGQLYAGFDAIRISTTPGGNTRVEFVLTGEVVSATTFRYQAEPIDVQTLDFHRGLGFIPISVEAP